MSVSLITGLSHWTGMGRGGRAGEWAECGWEWGQGYGVFGPRDGVVGGSRGVLMTPCY